MTIDQTTALIGAFALLLTAIGTVVTGAVSLLNLRTLKQVAHQTNGMHTQLMAAAKEEGRQEGGGGGKPEGKPSGDLVSSHLRGPA